MSEAKADKLSMPEMIERYVKLRDLKEAANNNFKEKMRPLNEAMAAMEVQFLADLQSQGVESVRTESGTAFINTKSSATVKDPELFMDFVKNANEWGLLDIRVNKTAAKEQFNAGVDVPGVKYTETLAVGVRRGKA